MTMHSFDLYFVAKSIANSKAFMEESDPSIGTKILDTLLLEAFEKTWFLKFIDASHRKYASHRFDATYLTDSMYSIRKIYKIFGHISNKVSGDDGCVRKTERKRLV